MGQGQRPLLARLGLATIGAALLAPALLLLPAAARTLAHPTKRNLQEFVDTAFFWELVGGVTTALIVIAIGIPSYLILRRFKRARPGTAALAGIVVGSTFTWIIGEGSSTGVLIGAGLGLITALLFLRIAGPSEKNGIA